MLSLSQPSRAAVCPVRATPEVDWRQDLPWFMKDLVVPPVDFRVTRDVEMLADRALGRDADQGDCYCAYRYVLTDLRAEDEDVLFEVPVYAQTVTAWRLQDGRWLQLHKVFEDFETGARQTTLSIAECMPR